MDKEISHYVVTSHPPGSVLATARCNFTSTETFDVLIAKSRRLEVRQWKNGNFSVVQTYPINGRIIHLAALPAVSGNLQNVFFLTERFQYAAIAYDPSQKPHPAVTRGSGSLEDNGAPGKASENPLMVVDKYGRCVALHLYVGFLTIIPYQNGKLQTPFHVRLEQAHKILAMCFMITKNDKDAPTLCILYQSHAHQHVTSARIVGKELHFQSVKSRVDGGSSLLLPVPPCGGESMGGVVVIGQLQWTYLQMNGLAKVVPVRQALFLCSEELPAEPLPRFLLADEFGNWHVLTILLDQDKVVALQRDVLGSCTLCNHLVYLEQGLVFGGSRLGDSQLIQMHDQAIDDAYLSVVEEYTQLGPILDLDTNGPIVVTASGSSQFGSLRLVRNGIGMNEYAAVEMPGIQNMFRLRSSSQDSDQYLVQTFVGETRVLGVVEREDVGSTLEEVWLAGLDSQAMSLFVGNVSGGAWVQVTESAVRLCTADSVLDVWTPEQQITVATANQSGQIAVALQGGLVKYLTVEEGTSLKLQGSQAMDNEVSCLNLDPLLSDAMDTGTSHSAEIVAVGLWDDFTVRFLSLNTLEETLCVHLNEPSDMETDDRHQRHNMMARSLCLLTLELDNNKNVSVNMLFVGLGDGTLISFAVSDSKGVISVHSRKEVCLGTQRIDLVPLHTEEGGTCVLATGDRPTVIYLAGLSNKNPKLCYSNVNLSASDEEDVDRSQQSIAVNVATPFVSPVIFDTMGSQHYSLCVADDAHMRLGVIDDIQKLHVTTCRLGMAPRRIVHCPEGRLFAVGCLESGIKHLGVLQGDDETSMGNCIRAMDDTSFDDLERIDLEPFEMILAMEYASLKVGSATHPYLIVGTAYSLPSEDEPTRGRVLVYSCQPEESGTSTAEDTRTLRPIVEMTTPGAVYSICQFYEGKILATIGSQTMVCQLNKDAGVIRLEFVGRGHQGNILSLVVRSQAQRVLPEEQQQSDETKSPNAMMEMKEEQTPKTEKKQDQFAIVGDLMRSISLVQYYPEHKALEEIARDFNSNWTTAIEMLHENVYVGAENWNNLFCLRRNTVSSSAEVQCRLETVGEFHLGEMCNKFLPGSLVMPVASSKSKVRSNGESQPAKGNRAIARRPPVVTGSQVLFGTVDGTLGSMLGLDGKTSLFFGCLERAMGAVIEPIGDLDHRSFRAVQASSNRVHPAHGFVDGDLVETFLDLSQDLMEKVVEEMNRDGGWEADDDDVIMMNMRDSTSTTKNPTDAERGELAVDDVVAMVEEISMLH